MTTDDYAHVTATVRKSTRGAVLLDDGEIEDWIPRSCLHGADDLYLNSIPADGDGTEHEFRIREWVARVKGFV